MHETSDALPPKRPDGIATGTETTLPGNGCLYFHNNDSNDDYAYNFRTLEKQCPTADNSALEEVAQPMYALGGEATYAGMRAAGDEVEETIHNKPLPLYDRIDGEKAIAEIAAQSRIKPHQAASSRIKPHQAASSRIKPLLASEQSCANSDRDEECGSYWLLVQSADGTTGWMTYGTIDSDYIGKSSCCSNG